MAKRTKKEPKPKKVTKEQQIEQLKEHAREYDFSYKPQIIDLTKDHAECARVTEGTCWRPDIFLNNNRTCNNCVLHAHCACPSKRVETKKKNVSR